MDRIKTSVRLKPEHCAFVAFPAGSRRAVEHLAVSCGQQIANRVEAVPAGEVMQLRVLAARSDLEHEVEVTNPPCTVNRAVDVAVPVFGQTASRRALRAGACECMKHMEFSGRSHPKHCAAAIPVPAR